MKKDASEAATRYCAYFSTQIERISNLAGESSELFKKILFCSVLDALSRSIYPSKKPRERFTSLVRKFGRWPHKDRLSLPHLGRLLELIPDPDFDKIRQLTFEKLAQWEAPWGTIPLDQDPHYDEIAKYWPNGVELKEPFKMINLRSLTHLQLLYSHRNSLFHEFRVPGYGIEIDDDDEPYYHDLTTIVDNGEPDRVSLELVYPVRFFELLCLTVLEGLKECFEKNELNPNDSYRFGSYWMEDLN